MELVFTLKGLDCPHCAAKIEEAVSKLDAVTSAAVNLMKEQLTVQTTAHPDALTAQITALVHEHEPDVTVTRETAPVRTYTYMLKGLDCPHCAAEIEEAAAALPEVREACPLPVFMASRTSESSAWLVRFSF